MKTRFFAILFVLILVSCSSSVEPLVLDMDMEPQELLEQPTSTIDYRALDNWLFHPDQTINFLAEYDLDIGIVDKDLQLEGSIQIENNARTDTGVDVFFVHPTQLIGTAQEPALIPLSEQPSLQIGLTVIAQAGQLAKYGRVFAPSYRQSTGPTYLQDGIDKDLQASIIIQSYSDVKAAFLEYMNNYNNGNKIILAGHSQGAYLTAMLVRDLFDQDITMQNLLVTAVLGGMGYVYANEGTYVGGQFENIGLCRQIEECGCVQNWGSYKEGQPINFFSDDLPWFNEEMVKYGVVHRTMDLGRDWFVMDEAFIPNTLSPLRYIALEANVNESHGFNFLAHDSLYLARTRRDSQTAIGLNIQFSPVDGDLRINDLAIAEADPLFDFWGYHTKDYNTYLWPLLEQIDAKLAQCN